MRISTSTTIQEVHFPTGRVTSTTLEVMVVHSYR